MSLQGTMNWKVVGEKRAIQIGDVIGKGGQSTVYKGVFDQKLVAVKIIANGGDDKEVKILRKLDHPNIIKIFFTDTSHPMTFMALELCEHTLKEETDLFSLGVIFYYTLSNGKHPFECELKIRDCEPCLDELESEYAGIVETLILSLLRKNYWERPSVSEVKSHHIFWDGEKKLDFLQKASDYMENRVKHEALIKKLEIFRHDVTCGKNWKDVICSETHNREIKRVIEKDKHCESKISLQHLLRKIRNWASHYFDAKTTEEFRTELGGYPNGFVNFFLSHFPKLLPCVFEIMMTQKNEDIFKLFYVTEIDSTMELRPEEKEEPLPGATVSSPIDADSKDAEESDDTDYEDILSSSVRNGNNTNPTLNRIQISEYNFREARHGINPPSVRPKVKKKSAANVIPSTWVDMKGHRVLKIKLSSTKQEYTTVVYKFITAGGRKTIVKIERIQNPDIYKLYVIKKAKVANKKLTSGNPVERELFFGTTDEDKISLHGFYRNYSEKDATAFGRGVYFTTTASYSDRFASADSMRRKRMFLANVVTGDYCLGNKAYCAPPQSGTVKNGRFDSVVNNMVKPAIFLIFEDASAYPTYLITYI